MFLRNPDLNLTASRIETPRCVLIPFSSDGRVELRELQEEFCRANKNLYVSPFLPNYEQEVAFVKTQEEAIIKGEVFENFILSRQTGRFIGCIGLNKPEEHRMNIGLWIREDEQGK